MNCKLLVVMLVVCMTASCAFEQAPAGYSKVWEDTFDGTSLDTSNWTIGCKDPGSGDLIAGAAGAYLLNTGYAGYITADDVWVSGGSLYLQNQKRNYTGTDPAGSFEYTTGWIMSMHKVHFNRGYLEMRAKYPSGSKVWPAFWLIAEDLVWGPEWDIFEYFGYRSDYGYDVMVTALAYGEEPNISWLADHISGYNSTYDCQAWHVYGFEWTADYAKWYIDGVEVTTMDNTIGNRWPNEEMYIVLNNGVHGNAPDNKTTWPNHFVIDYIKLYKLLPAICGNANCDLGEDQCNCPEDCGTPPATETSCTDGIDNDCDTYTDCADADCESIPPCDCLPSGSSCTEDAECCSNKCRGGKCRG